MPILLDVLAEKSVAKDFNNAGSFPGLNSVCKTQAHVNDWHPWEDFTYDTIKQIFKKELSRRYKGESEPQPLPLDLRVLKEDATQDALGRFPIPIVNYALNSIGGTEHFSRGSRCYQHGVYIPDWSVVSQSHVGVTGGMLNILPGDTKISSKWWSSMLKDFDNFDEWKKVLNQIVTYMASCSVRYGFIVTDIKVVALRITRQHVPKGLASSRTRREPGSKAPIIISSNPASHTSSEGF